MGFGLNHGKGGARHIEPDMRMNQWEKRYE